MSFLKESFTESIFNLMVSGVAVKILGMIYKLYITNRSGYGDLGNAITGASFQVYALVLSFVCLGIPNAISKIVAERCSNNDFKGAHKVFKVSLIFVGSIGIFASYLLYIFADVIAKNYLNIDETKLSIIVLAPSVFLMSLVSCFRGYFQGREAIKFTARSQTFEQLTRTVTAVAMIELSVFLTKKESTEIMAALNNFAITLGNIIELTYLYLKYIKMKPQILKEILMSSSKYKIIDEKMSKKYFTKIFATDFSKRNTTFEISKEIFKFALPITLSTLIVSVSKSIDSVTIVNDLQNVIGEISAKKQYGILSGKVESLINFPLSFNTAISGALLPTIVMYKNNLKEKSSRFKKAFVFEMLIAFFVMIFYLIFANLILKICFPNAPEGATLLRISSLSIIFLSIEGFLNTILNGIGKIYEPIKATVIGTIVKFTLNKILIPKPEFFLGGINGAAFATLVSHIVISILLILKLRKIYKFKIINN